MSTIDVTNPIGPVTALHGVNIGPIDRRWGRDYSAYFAEAQIPSVRLHDLPLLAAEAADLHTIFPNPQADPDDPASYTFGVTDHYLAAIRAAGGEPYFRLGESIEHEPEKVFVWGNRWTPEALAKVCANIVRHYNHGWANGFEWNIRYWEFWNEPDGGNGETPPHRRSCFAGSAEEFLDLYRAVAPAIKEADPNAQVGLAGWTGRWLRAWLAADVEDRDGWSGWLGVVTRAVEEGLPIDFVSWHDYPGTWSDISTLALGIRERLDALGLTEAESHLTEWCWIPPMRDEQGEFTFMKVRMGTHPDRYEAAYEYMNGVRGAGFTFGTLAMLQDLPVELAHHYTGTSENWGLFRVSGRPTTKYQAFVAFTEFLGEGVERLAVSGVDERLRVLAVRTADGVKVAIANHDEVPEGLTVALDGAQELTITGVKRLVEEGWAEGAATLTDAALTVDTSEPGIVIVDLG